MENNITVEKLEENTFKFIVGTKEERDRIYNGRSWSLNGVNLILKIWDADQALDEISFRISTFILQIHGLPPVFIHQGTAEKIGNRVGLVHKNNINKKCIVANRFLRVKVDMEVIQPIPAGFFQEREGGENLWIQFKYERLSDLCYKCGSISHVTMKCSFNRPAYITTHLDILAKIYGPWLKAAIPGSLLFVNLEEDEDGGWLQSKALEIVKDLLENDKSVGCGLKSNDHSSDQNRQPDSEQADE